jgi:hypothetical protein
MSFTRFRLKARPDSSTNMPSLFFTADVVSCGALGSPCSTVDRLIDGVFRVKILCTRAHPQLAPLAIGCRHCWQLSAALKVRPHRRAAEATAAVVGTSRVPRMSLFVLRGRHDDGPGEASSCLWRAVAVQAGATFPRSFAELGGATSDGLHSAVGKGSEEVSEENHGACTLLKPGATLRSRIIVIAQPKNRIRLKTAGLKSIEGECTRKS